MRGKITAERSSNTPASLLPILSAICFSLSEWQEPGTRSLSIKKNNNIGSKATPGHKHTQMFFHCPWATVTHFSACCPCPIPIKRQQGDSAVRERPKTNEHEEAWPRRRIQYSTAVCLGFLRRYSISSLTDSIIYCSGLTFNLKVTTTQQAAAVSWADTTPADPGWTSRQDSPQGNTA